MTPDRPANPTDDRAALFAAGEVPADGCEAGLLAEALAAGFGPVVAALGAAIPEVQPPPAVKDRLLAQIGSGSPGLTIRRRTDDRFTPTRFPGVAVRLLNLDRERRQFTALMKVEPGGRIPEHAHDGPEECLVLEGELLVGDIRLRAGDYQRVEPGTDHREQWTDTGALLFLTGPLSMLAL